MSVFSRALKKMPAVLWVELLLVVVFSFFSRNYLTTRNLLILLQQGAVLLVISAAATFVIISGGLDLSLGAIMTLAGVFTALAVNAGFPIPVVIAVGAAVGIACGAVNGLFISYAGMEPFIATLGMQGLLYGIALALTNKEGIPVSNERFIFLGDLVNRTVPMAAISCGLIFLLAVFVQNHTLLGRYTYAIGGNEEGARLSGVGTKFWKWAIYAFAGLLTGLGAVVLVARLEVADPIVGMQWEFEAIAAAILGGTSLRIGRGDVRGTLVGVLLITIIRSGLNVVRVPSIWQPAIIGTIIILSIVFQVWTSTSGKDRK
jgi:ribose transport system permease protein